MQKNDPAPLSRAQKAILLDTVGDQIVKRSGLGDCNFLLKCEALLFVICGTVRPCLRVEVRLTVLCVVPEGLNGP